MPLVEALGCKLPFQPPAESADLAAFEQRCHGDRQRCILRNFRKKIRLRIQVRHQFAAVPHQKKVHVIVVIVDGVQQSQQTALHSAKLHGLGEDENGVRYFLGIIQIRLLFHLFLPQILFSFLGDLHIVTIPQSK